MRWKLDTSPFHSPPPLIFPGQNHWSVFKVILCFTCLLIAGCRFAAADNDLKIKEPAEDGWRHHRHSDEPMVVPLFISSRIVEPSKGHFILEFSETNVGKSSKVIDAVRGPLGDFDHFVGIYVYKISTGQWMDRNNVENLPSWSFVKSPPFIPQGLGGGAPLEPGATFTSHFDLSEEFNLGEGEYVVYVSLPNGPSFLTNTMLRVFGSERGSLLKSPR